jgi:hypothetical protein
LSTLQDASCRPTEIDRCWTLYIEQRFRFRQTRVDARTIAGGIVCRAACSKRHTIRSRTSNRRCAADLHRADGVGYLFDGGAAHNSGFIRQQTLIDQADLTRFPPTSWGEGSFRL